MKRCLHTVMASIFLLSSLWGCATTKPTGLQKQSLETVYIEAKFDVVFKAIRSTFLNEGYTIKQSEYDSGLLLFTKPYELTSGEKTKDIVGGCLQGCSFTSCLGLWLKGQAEAKKGTDIVVTVTLIDLKDKTEARTSFVNVPIEKTEEYGIFLKRIYADVKKHVMIRQNK